MIRALPIFDLFCRLHAQESCRRDSIVFINTLVPELAQNPEEFRISSNHRPAICAHWVATRPEDGRPGLRLSMSWVVRASIAEEGRG